MMPNLWRGAVAPSSFELSLLAKATLILLVGLAVTALARTARASARHLVIATLFVALIALPLLIVFVPAMAIDVPIAKVQTALQTLGNPNQGIAPTSAERAAEIVSSTAERTLPGLHVAQWARIVRAPARSSS